MNIPEAEFNKYGVVSNSVFISEWGNDFVKYEVKAAVLNGRVIASSSARTNTEGFGFPLSEKSFDFQDEKEAISFYKKQALKWAKKTGQKNFQIIKKSIEECEEPEQFELF